MKFKKTYFKKMLRFLHDKYTFILIVTNNQIKSFFNAFTLLRQILILVVIYKVSD